MVRFSKEVRHLSWFDLVKNQKTFQSLGIGEIDLESSVDEEEDSCLKRVHRIVERLGVIEKELVARTGFIKHEGRTFYRNKLDYEHGYMPKDTPNLLRNPYIRFDMYSIDNLDEEAACELLESIDEFKQKRMGGIPYFKPIYYVMDGDEVGRYWAQAESKEHGRYGEISIRLRRLSPEIVKEFSEKITRAFDV